jgi:hypothetical protein
MSRNYIYINLHKSFKDLVNVSIYELIAGPIAPTVIEPLAIYV